jgi:NADH-quinone oxidoreductase subunit G
VIVLKINQNIFVVKEDISVLEACKFVGIKIPRFCYHETLSISGNCRMCLVKLESDDKLIISCLTRVESDMEVLSNDPVIQKAREEILEFLLLDHPLDCPICDQGGECDLQDQAKNFGSGFSKLSLNKQPVEDKDFGVFIKAIMTRCIHCTRCVRFSSEVAGVDFFGALNRGNKTEIGLYSSSFFLSEIASNVVDLCPVGALTSKPYVFKARPWELKSVNSIDLSDGMGSHIYVNFVDSEVARILPKFNSEINETIITDKARYFYDSLYSYNNLNQCFKFKDYNKTIFSAYECFKYLRDSLSDKKILVVVSEDVNFETLNLLKKISYSNKFVKLRYLGSSVIKNNFFTNTLNDISSIKEAQNTVFLIAVNPRTEAALVNNRLRFLSVTDYFNIYSIGLKFSSNLKNSFLNLNINEVIKLFEGKSSCLSYLLTKPNPLFILGNSLSERGVNINYVESLLKQLNPSLYLFNIYHKCNTTGLHFSNIQPLSLKSLLDSDFIFFFECRETVFLKQKLLSYLSSKMVFWFNSYMLNYTLSNGYQIPIKNIFENAGIFFNLEFRPQKANKIFDSKIASLSSFKILNALFNVRKVHSNSNLFIKNMLADVNLHAHSFLKPYLLNFRIGSFISSEFSVFSSYPIKAQVLDFFKTDKQCDFSKNMLLASRYFQRNDNNFF